jgi:hypothetical protein
LDWLFAEIFDFIAYLLRILVVRAFVPDDLLAKRFEKATCLSEAVQFVKERGEAAGLARLRLDVHVEGVEAPVVLVPLLAGYGPTVSILVSMFLWKFPPPPPHTSGFILEKVRQNVRYFEVFRLKKCAKK